MADPEESAAEEISALSKVELLKRRRRRAKWLGWALLLAVIGGGIGLWRLWPDLLGQASEPVAESERVPEPATGEPTPPEPRRAREPRAPRSASAASPSRPSPAAAPVAVPLPDLDASDVRVREEAASLSSHRQLADWLSVDDLVRRAVLAVVNVREGANPRKSLAPLGPEAGFGVRESDEGRFTTLPAAHARYDAFAGFVASLDARACASLFEHFEPLLDAAYAELGFPDQPFRSAVAEAAVEILATPHLEAEVELIFHVNHYRYADPALEDLSPVQKQLLRTGPDNAQRIRSKVREMALALGVPGRQLPESPVDRAGVR